MPSNNDLINKALSSIPTVTSKLAIFVQRVGFRVVVNIGATSATLPFVGTYLPPPGFAVQLEYRPTGWVVTGPALPLPAEGVVTGTGSPRATVTAWGTAYTLRYRDGYTPVLNDLVSISWNGEGEGWIIGKLTASSSATGPSANGAATGQKVRPPAFTAIDSGTYRAGSGWWTRTVRANVDDGAWFYGTKIRDSIPDTATPTRARIYLPILEINIDAPGQLRLHTHRKKPAGAPSFTGSAYPVPAVSGWRDIPLSWIDFLKANDGGIGFDGGGFWIVRGTDTDAQSGALDITYKT